MKIYTKTGDTGETGLFAGPRVSKADLRIEAYGTVDELNAVLGWVRAQQLPVAIERLLAKVQHELFVLGAELATPQPDKLKLIRIGSAHVEFLERAIDDFEAGLQPLTQFILPGGSQAAAAIHVARTVCRRAERRVVELRESMSSPIADSPIIYLNRLSDLLFVLARSTNHQAGVPDEPWEQLT